MRARRPSRSNNRLLVASAALSRAVDPAKPSRITVIRLLGDALHALKESQLTVDAVRLRSASFSSRESLQRLNRSQLEADSRFRAAHEQGARSLFSIAVTVLLKLPCKAGPLRRRAIDIIHVAGRAAGPAVAMQAVDRVRGHINGLKKLSWSESERSDFEVNCALLTLADLSNCVIAGRDVARDSILFLLSHRVRQKSNRNDLSYAIAQILQSIPPHAPPDDRLVDDILDFCFSPSSVRQGSAGFGTALLTAAIVPFLVSRGPVPADDIVNKSAKALRLAPTPTERGMWGLAIVRASVTARRSTTYQLHKYGTSDMTSKFPREPSSGGPIKFTSNSNGSTASTWVSNEIFEESLLQVSTAVGLSEGKSDAVVAVAGVLRMWVQALPDTIPIIIPRVFGKLLTEPQSIIAVSALVDAIWRGVLKNLKPSASSRVVENLLPSLDENGLPLAAALHVSANLLSVHGRQALRETGLTLDYNHMTATMIKRALETVEQRSFAVRTGSVRLIASIIGALPRTCSKFLTAVLQNLRIADLQLATKEIILPKEANADVIHHAEINEPELSALLGNAAALAMLIDKVSTSVCSVPAALLRQCAIDSLALLRPHHARDEGNACGLVASCVRRRAGWGLVAAMAKAKMKYLFEGDALKSTIEMWMGDLGFAKDKSSGEDFSMSYLQHYPIAPIWDISDDISTSNFEQIVARSSVRTAALFSLFCALRNVPSTRLKDCAETLLGSSAARIVGALASHVSPQYLSAQSSTGRISFAVDEIAGGDSAKKLKCYRLVKVLTVEAVQLAKCIHIVPPRGDSGELCYTVCIALIEEAQRVLGEGDTGYNMDSVLTHGSSQKELPTSALGNSTPSLLRISTAVQASFKRHIPAGLKSEIARKSYNGSQYDVAEGEWSWLFGKKGLCTPSAEGTFTDAARSVAAVVSEDLADHGNLLEALSSAKLSPTFSAVVALEMARQLSHSHLAEINRVLAVLQLLTRNSLAITRGCKRSITSQTKTGRLYTPSSQGDSICLTKFDIPGSLLQSVKSGSWLSWTRGAPDECNILRAPFQNFHTRAFAAMVATRSIAAEAHRELSVTGGTPLWTGMMRKVLSVVRDNMGSSTPTQSIILSSAITTLGALLEVIPEMQTSSKEVKGESATYSDDSSSETLDEIAAEAVNMIATLIENGRAEVQAAASLALSSCSHRIASSSERILAALLRAWAEDKGEFHSLGHFGKCYDEADIWSLCFLHVWSDMGIRESGNRTRFYSSDSNGIGTASPFFVTGAAAVLSSCRLHWWPLSESSYFTIKEMSTELLQWHGDTSGRARAAGLHGMTALWAAKIDSAKAKKLTSIAKESLGWSKRLSRDAAQLGDDPAVPVEHFSLKDPSRMTSPVGPFLDEVLYAALAPPVEMEGIHELQDAACLAVFELFRGGGVEAVSANLPRLPENLFAALDKGVDGSKRLLKMLVRNDAALRPRYWFGLCRAIAFDSERLNYGQSRCKWDLSLETKSFSVYIASEAVNLSLASCTCLPKQEGGVGKEAISSHSCAYGFLRKIVDFAKQICRGDSFDSQACREACRLLQNIVVRFESCFEDSNRNTEVLKEFNEVWKPCVPVLNQLMNDQVPLDVLNAVAEALCEELIFNLRLQRKNGALTSEFSSEAVFSFLEAGSLSSLKGRFLFLDQGEEVGIHTTLCLLATCGRLLSALRVSGEGSSNVFKERMMHSGTAERLLFSMCGDFISTLQGNGLSILARCGGSLTSSTRVESILQASLLVCATPITLGSVSCFGFGHFDTDIITEGDVWENPAAAGVRMSGYGKRDELIVTSAFVWLLLHERGDIFRKESLASHYSQCRDALECLCYIDAPVDQVTKEVFTCFCDWDTDAFIQLGRELSSRQRLSLSRRNLIIELTLSVISASARSNIEDMEKSDVERFGKAFLSLSDLVMGNHDNSSRDGQCAKVLDVVLSLVERDNASLLVAPEVLPALCTLASTCILQNDQLRTKAKDYFATFKKLCERGWRCHSESEIRLGASLSASLCSMSICSQEYFLTEFLVSFVSIQDKLKAASFGLSTIFDAHGVEDIVSSLISSLSTKKTLSECQGIIWMLNTLGFLAISPSRFNVGVAMRSAIAAVLVEGECAPVVNMLGMIVYTALLSRLVFELPTTVEPEAELAGGKDSLYLTSLLHDGMLSVESLASSLSEHERRSVSAFLVKWKAVGT